MTSGTVSTRTQSHSLTPLAQVLSLCHRYQLPLSLLAIQLKDLGATGKALGTQGTQKLQQQLGQALRKKVRLEDALVCWQRGYLVLGLPGTGAGGAACVARRLDAWFQDTRFTLESTSVQLDTAMSVHVADPTLDADREHIRELLMDTLCLLATEEDTDGPVLSRRAREQTRLEPRPAAPPINGERRTAPAKDAGDAPAGNGSANGAAHGHLNGHADLGALVRTLGQSGEQNLINALSPALCKLDEPTRMRLVDQLLEASLMPNAH